VSSQAPRAASDHPRSTTSPAQTPSIAIDPQARVLLTQDTLEEIEDALAQGVTCTVCETPIRPEHDEPASILVLRPPARARMLIRFAHQRCAAPRLIDIDHPLQAPAPPPVREPRHAELAWALAARGSLTPTIILAWDLELASAVEVRGRILLDALRLHGLRGGRPLEQIQPARTQAITITRDGATLAIDCEYGCEPLVLPDLHSVLPALHVAARQREILLIAGERLSLGASDLAEAERRLCYGEAVAARVGYSDPELASIPLHSNSRRRIARRLLTLTPSTRARARHRRDGTALRAAAAPAAQAAHAPGLRDTALA
jgi:hypothetical protein